MTPTMGLEMETLQCQEVENYLRGSPPIPLIIAFIHSKIHVRTEVSVSYTQELYPKPQLVLKN